VNPLDARASFAHTGAGSCHPAGELSERGHSWHVALGSLPAARATHLQGSSRGVAVSGAASLSAWFTCRPQFYSGAEDVTSDQAQLPGELLYEFTLKITQVVEYGVSMDALLSGQAPPPGEGVRLDIHFEGTISGAKLNGSVRGVDHLHVRADGRMQLDIHGEITTDDGKKIALYADGVAMGQPPVLQLRQNATLTTSHPEYSWVNTLQVWALGTGDLVNGEVRVKGYAV